MIERIAIVCDRAGLWFVRRIRLLEHDLTRDEKVYYCDQPISGPHKSLADVPQVQKALSPSAGENET